MKFLILVLFCICRSVYGEVYKDFAPFTTVAQIKRNYGNAKIEVIKAGWVKENDLFLKVSGPGLPGVTYVATIKRSDDEVKETIERYKSIIAKETTDDNSFLQKLISSNEAYLNAEEDTKYSVSWVRWVPDESIPFERLKSKFGEPTKFDFGEDDFQPYAEWSARKVLARLSDDKKLVYSIEYHFTDEDYNRALGVDDKPIESTENKPLSSPKPKVKSKVKKATM